jgi:hypothetical protein
LTNWGSFRISPVTMPGPEASSWITEEGEGWGEGEEVAGYVFGGGGGIFVG